MGIGTIEAPAQVGDNGSRMIVWRTLAVCVSCYVGAWLGTALTFSKDGAALLFGPYAVLLLALVSSRPSQWWPYVLANSLGSFAAHGSHGAALPFAALVEIANVSRVVAAVVVMRSLGFRSADDFKGMSRFIAGAAVMGPLAGATVGAAIVAHTRGSDYFTPWREWFLSNALTALTLFPLLEGSLAALRSRPPWTARRSIEAMALGVLLAGCSSAFAVSHAELGTLPIRVYWPLPLLLWAAVRFGTRGTSAALLVVTLGTAWGTIHGRGAFSVVSPAETLVHIQLFLITLSVPLLLLASLVQQVRLTEASMPSRADDGSWQHDAGTLTAGRVNTVTSRHLAQMTRRMEGLLDLSSVSRSSVDFRFDTVDLNEAVQLGLETAMPALEAKRHVVTLTCGPGPVYVGGDRGRLARALANVLYNVARYMDTGGRIAVSIARDGDVAMLSVREDGTCIPARELSAVFDPFTQAADGDGPSHDGLRIGLALVRRLIELHGGTVQARSDGTGHGSEIVVTLPALPTETHASVDPDPPRARG